MIYSNFINNLHTNDAFITQFLQVVFVLFVETALMLIARRTAFAFRVRDENKKQSTSYRTRSLHNVNNPIVLLHSNAMKNAFVDSEGR